MLKVLLLAIQLAIGYWLYRIVEKSKGKDPAVYHVAFAFMVLWILGIPGMLFFLST